MSAAPGCVPDETSYGLSEVWEGRRETTGCIFFVVFFVFLPLFSLCLMSWQGSATF